MRPLIVPSVVLLIIVFFPGCGGSEDESVGENDPMHKNLLLFMTSGSDTSGSTYYPRFVPKGYASLGSAGQYCPVLQQEEVRNLTGITITWINESTGDTGDLRQTLVYGLVIPFGYGCWHIWEAMSNPADPASLPYIIPLAPGYNSVVIHAENEEGNWDEMYFEVELL